MLAVALVVAPAVAPVDIVAQIVLEGFAPLAQVGLRLLALRSAHAE